MEADWTAPGDQPESQNNSSKPKHNHFGGLVLGPARGLTDTGAQQPVVGTSAAQWWCERLRKRHGMVPVDVTPTNMVSTYGGIGSAKVVRVLDFPARMVGVNGVMRFSVHEESMSDDGKRQFIPPLTPVTLMRQLGAHTRMKESGDVFEVKDDRRKIHCEKLVRGRSGHVHNQLDAFSKGGWKLPVNLRDQLRYDTFIATNLGAGSTYGTYEFKKTQQTKLEKTHECYCLEVLDTVNTSAVGYRQDRALPEDLWPNINAMVAKLQENYIGSHEEMLIAHRDFGAGSSSSPTTILYRVHVKPRSMMFDPSLCATSQFHPRQRNLDSLG